MIAFIIYVNHFIRILDVQCVVLVTLRSCTFISTYRYITRAVLIPFADVNEMTSAERMDADKSLRLAMKKAGRAAAVMVSLGKELLSPESSEYLKVIVQKVETVVKGHRMVLSYSWLLLATFQVIITNQHLLLTNTHLFFYLYTLSLLLIIFPQVLTAAGKLTDEMEDCIWRFFFKDMVTSINTYQLMQSHQQLTIKDIEEILCEAVIGEGISKVIVYLTRCH